MKNTVHHYHFIGIGGIGMSGLAAVVRAQGHRVSGCDRNLNQHSITLLRPLGCTIGEHNDPTICHDNTIDIIVYSSDIPPTHPELERARTRKIALLHRSELLAQLTHSHITIAISGAHGKTTTTAMVGQVLAEAQKDPTILVGGFAHNFGSNARLGSSKYLVAEADESDRSFTRLFPTIAVITNIDLEHLNTYTDINDIEKEFAHFLDRLPVDGKAIICIDDQNIRDMISRYLSPDRQRQLITYGKSAEAQYQLINTNVFADRGEAQVKLPDGRIASFSLPMPGEHNLLNATAAIAVAHELGIDFTTSAAALAKFLGVEQRFTYCGIFQGAEVFDDYGHHPTEIKNMLVIARKRARNRLIVVFQPQRFSRTEKLWNEFVALFKNGPHIDTLIIAPIYPASEAPRPGITGDRLAQEIQQVVSYPVIYCAEEPGWQKLKVLLQEKVGKGDLILFLGAGKVNKVAHEIAHKNS